MLAQSIKREWFTIQIYRLHHDPFSCFCRLHLSPLLVCGYTLLDCVREKSRGFVVILWVEIIFAIDYGEKKMTEGSGWTMGCFPSSELIKFRQGWRLQI